MRTISQRELRNDNAEIMRAVEQGETFTVTRRGVPVARVTPVPIEADLRCVKPARPGPHLTDLRRVVTSRPTAEHLDDLRGES